MNICLINPVIATTKPADSWTCLFNIDSQSQRKLSVVALHFSKNTLPYYKTIKSAISLFTPSRQFSRIILAYNDVDDPSVVYNF